MAKRTNPADFLPWPSRWMRPKITYVFAGFPKCIAEIVADYSMILELLDWIDPKKLDYCNVSCNSMTFDYSIHSKAVDYSDYDRVVVHSEHPAAITMVRANYKKYAKYPAFWGNPSHIAKILEYLDDLINSCKWREPKIKSGNISFYYLSKNPHPRAIAWLLANPDYIRWDGLTTNPAAIDILRAHPDKIHKFAIYANPAAIDTIKQEISTKYDSQLMFEVFSNPHPWAIEFAHTHPDLISWTWLSYNPGIFRYKRDPKLIKELTEF